MSAQLTELVEAGDLNGLLRAVDGLCADRSWDELLRLADRCADAIERGKQLWPITEHIDYRLALEAPGEYAARVLKPDVGRFAHGPLTEVAASTHAWAELAPHIGTPQAAAYVAQERVLRGEVLTGDGRAHPEVLELPLNLQGWEPTYCLAVFRADHVEVPEPWDPRAPFEEIATDPGAVVEDSELTGALLDLVQPWISESNGAAQVVVVEGGAAAAAAALTYGPLRMGSLEPAEAVQAMAWAAASGGAHGRRRGAALGRFAAWYTAALLSGLEWPVDPDDLGRELEHLAWHRWDEGEPEEGWVLRLAIEHADGWAAAIGASDVLEEANE
ncbi:MAG: hypothetical protein ACRDJI_10525 [Actinomycetota bacterium]